MSPANPVLDPFVASNWLQFFYNAKTRFGSKSLASAIEDACDNGLDRHTASVFYYTWLTYTINSSAANKVRIIDVMSTYPLFIIDSINSAEGHSLKAVQHVIKHRRAFVAYISYARHASILMMCPRVVHESRIGAQIVYDNSNGEGLHLDHKPIVSTFANEIHLICRERYRELISCPADVLCRSGHTQLAYLCALSAVYSASKAALCDSSNLLSYVRSKKVGNICDIYAAIFALCHDAMHNCSPDEWLAMSPAVDPSRLQERQPSNKQILAQTTLTKEKYGRESAYAILEKIYSDSLKEKAPDPKNQNPTTKRVDDIIKNGRGILLEALSKHYGKKKSS